MRWFQILAGGILLFALTLEALVITGNPNFFPTVILLGAFIVPAAFVVYFYEYVRDRDISQPTLTACFLVGGTLGLVAAGFLEYSTLRNLGIFTLLGVAFIEESVKLIFPIGMFVGWRYRHEADGLLFGIAAGMGFAALETMGYALVSLIQSRGDIGILQQVLLIRGLFSPAGHAAWTGLVCAALWRQRQRTGHTLTLLVVGTFLLAVFLHTLWNTVSSLGAQTWIGLALLIAGLLAIATVSLTLVILRFRAARRSSAHSDSVLK